MSDRNLVHVSSLARNIRVGERSSTFDLGFAISAFGGSPWAVRYVAPVASGIQKGTGQDQRIGNKIALRRMVATVSYFWKPLFTSTFMDYTDSQWAALYTNFTKLITPCVCRLTVGKSVKVWDTGYDPTVPAWDFLQTVSPSPLSTAMQLSIHSAGLNYNTFLAVKDHIYQDETIYLRDDGRMATRDSTASIRESYNTTCIAGPSITDVYDSDAVAIKQQFANILLGLASAQTFSRDVEVVFDPPILVTYDDDGNIVSEYSPVIQFMSYYENFFSASILGLESACELGICITVEWDDGYFASNLRSRFRGVGEAAAAALDPDDPDDQDLASSLATANMPSSKDHMYGQEVRPTVQALAEFGVPRMTGAEIVRLAREEVEAEEARQSSVNVGPSFDDSEVVNGGKDARRAREEEDTVTFVRLHQGLSNKYRRGDIEESYESVYKKKK